jgi:two-component system LytT family response regulator
MELMTVAAPALRGPCGSVTFRQIEGYTLRALIVEDEPGSRDRLRRLLAKHTQIEIVGEADSGPRALEVIAEARPDLVFLDVSLPGFDGFALLDEIDVAIKVVFTTASADHAVRAFDAGAVHYLLKPIDPVQLEDAVARAQASELESSATTPPPLKRILCRDRDTTHVLHVDEILYMKADQGYTLVRTDPKEYLTSDSLGSLERIVGNTFARIHRNALVNIRQVKSLRHLDGDVVVVLRTGIELAVSRRHAQVLRERLLYSAG